MRVGSTNPVQPAFYKSNATNFGRKGETFHNIFQRSLNCKSNSPHPKTEMTGLLVPANKTIQGRLHKFKLDTAFKEYFLGLDKVLESIAHKIEWEEVTVKGHLDLDTNIFEVEKISVRQISEPMKTSISADDSLSESEFIARIIAQRGKIEPAFDELAS